MPRYLEGVRIPSLPRRRRRSVYLLARAVLMKKHPPRLGEVQLAFSIIRLVDDGFLHYRQARAGLYAFAKDRAANGFFQGVSSLEGCITSLHRAARMIRAFQRAGYVTPEGDPVIPRATGLSVTSRRTTRRLKELRDAIQHLDDRIVGGDLPRVQAMGPRPQSTILRIGGLSVRYVELRDWLVEMDVIAERVMVVEQTTRNRRRS